MTPQRRKGKTVFKFYAPDAKKVCVAGEFNGWDSETMPLRRDKEGTWKGSLDLPPGRYEYKYVIDGRWLHDVPGAEMVPNVFGTSNCVLRIK